MDMGIFLKKFITMILPYFDVKFDARQSGVQITYACTDDCSEDILVTGISVQIKTNKLKSFYLVRNLTFV